MQQPYCEQIQELINRLQAVLPCPVAVTPTYASKLKCPIFVPPIPLNCSAQTYLKQWKGRELWLELDNSGLLIELSEQGCKTTPTCEILNEPNFFDSDLHCHYHTTIIGEKAFFTLHRTDKDFEALLTEAQNYGVTLAVGLYQEFNRQFYLSSD